MENIVYGKEFKLEAVNNLRELTGKGQTVVNGEVIYNVRALVKELDISSSTLYRWAKQQTERERMLEKHLAKKEEEEEVKEEILSEVIDEGKQKDDIFGIRFWGWFAKVKGVKNYSSMPINQLKLKIGLILIQESELIDMVSNNHE